MERPADRDEYLVDVPDISKLTFQALEAPAVFWSELQAPASHRLIGDDNPSLREQILDIAKTQSEPLVQPDRVADDFWWESVSMVSVVLLFHPHIVSNDDST
jgi:hypothetical protein